MRLWNKVMLLMCLSGALAAREVASIEFQTFSIGNDRCHSAGAGLDGFMWYGGTYSSDIVSINPKTGERKTYYTGIPITRPHQVLTTADGTIWVPCMNSDTFTSVNPKTGELKNFPIPRDPKMPPGGSMALNSMAEDGKGNFWFTLSAASWVGRFDPRTGKSVTVPSPKRNSFPYGVTADAEGNGYYAEFGGYQLVMIRHDTLETKVIPLPEGVWPRRVTTGKKDGRIYFTDEAHGKIGSYDPKTGVVKEWPLPEGKMALPYVVKGADDGSIWYASVGDMLRPRIGRFDPETEKMQSFAVTGAGPIRNLVIQDGNVYYSLTSYNELQIARVTYK